MDEIVNFVSNYSSEYIDYFIKISVKLIDTNAESIVHITEKVEKLLDQIASGKYDIDVVHLLQKFILEHLNYVFGWKQMLHFLQMTFFLRLGLRSWEIFGGGIQRLMELMTASGRNRRKLRNDLYKSKTYEEWKSCAMAYDKTSDAYDWRERDQCEFYDEKAIRQRIKSIEKMMKNGDIFQLMFRLRGGLLRDAFGTQHAGLYQKALSGTKNIIEKYVQTSCDALEEIAASKVENIPSDVKLTFFNETRHSYGRSALLLSGGAYLGYYHMGVAKSLYEQGMLPRVISGASAGSLMAALIGTKTDEELELIFSGSDEAKDIFRRDHFAYIWERKTTKSAILDSFRSFFPSSYEYLGDILYCLLFDQNGLRLDISHLKEVAMNNMGEYTFQEAYDRTGRIINITAAPMNNYDPPRLLNYLTAPHVCVWSAALASCAIPGMFDAVPLIVKEPNGEFRVESNWSTVIQPPNKKGSLSRTMSLGGFSFYDKNKPAASQAPHVKVTKVYDEMDVVKYTDGSIDSDLPMVRLSELFNVNHFIVSQVNAHSCLFSASSLHSSVWAPPLFGACVAYARFLKALIKDYVKNIVDLWVYRLKAPIWASRRGLAQLLTQEYEGREQDITVMPWKDHISLPYAFSVVIRNPTDEEYFDVVNAAEKAMYPHLARVRAHCAVEMTLDSCVHYLREEAAHAKFADKLTTDSDENVNTNNTSLARKDSFRTSRSFVELRGMGEVTEGSVDKQVVNQSNGGDFSMRMKHDSGVVEYGKDILHLSEAHGYLNDEDIEHHSSSHVVHRTKASSYENKPLSRKGSRNNSASSLSGLDIEGEIDLPLATSSSYRNQDRMSTFYYQCESTAPSSDAACTPSPFYD